MSYALVQTDPSRKKRDGTAKVFAGLDAESEKEKFNKRVKKALSLYDNGIFSEDDLYEVLTSVSSTYYSFMFEHIFQVYLDNNISRYFDDSINNYLSKILIQHGKK